MSKMSRKNFEAEEAVTETLEEVKTVEPVEKGMAKPEKKVKEYVELDINNPAHGNLTDQERQAL